VATGTITAASVAERDPKVVALRSLMGVYGIGPAKAIALIGKGIMTIPQLKKRMNEDKLVTKA
jgi:predicted flap endonuclease-1-like 5' DNA nuclease